MARNIDPYQWESMKRLRTTNPIDSILKVMEHFSGMNEREGTRLANEGNFIQKQLDSATGMDDINRLSVRAQSYNTESAQSGFDYNIDYQNKKERFEEANMAYETGKKYVDMGLGDAKVQAENIMKLSWKDVAKEKNDLLNLKDGIAKGAQSNFDYKANGIYSQTGVLSALDTRLGQLAIREDLFEENKESFIVSKPDGTMDEESQKIFDEFQYRIISGDINEFDTKLDNYITSRQRDYGTARKSFIYWSKIEQELVAKQGKGETLTVGEVADTITDAESLSIFGASVDSYGKSKNDTLSLPWVRDRIFQAQEAGDKYNTQHRFLTGDDVEEETPWDPVNRDNRNIPGLTDSDPLYSIGDSQTGPQQDKQLDEQFAAGAVAEETPEGVAVTEKEMEAKIGKDFDVTTGEHAVSEADFETSPDWFKKIDEINNETSDEEGIQEGSTLKNIAIITTAGAGMLYKDKIAAVAKTAYDSTKKAASWIKSSTNISANQTTKILESPELSKYIKSLNVAKEELKGLGDIIEQSSDEYKELDKKGKNQVLKDNKKIRALKTQIKAMESKGYKVLQNKFGVSADDAKKLIRSKNIGKWNIFNVKSSLIDKFPKAAADFFTGKVEPTSKVGKLVKGTGKLGYGLAQFRTGKAVSDVFGLDIGEGVLAETAEGTAGTAVSYTAIKKTAEKFLPKLKRIAQSPAGKAALRKMLGKTITNKLVAGTISGAGFASLVTGGIGLILTANDIRNFVKNWKEE